jgi:2-keto-4-pentenoate hydratase
MDDPYLSLLRLCKNLGKYGISLVPGQKIITGAFSHHRVPIGGVWKASFGGIGTVELTFV